MIGLSLQGVLATLCIVHVHGALIQVVDLTHTVDESSIAWPGNPDFVFTKIFRGNNTENGFWYESNSFSTPEHSGTHLDAPAHFAYNRWRTADIPASHLVGPGVIINVTDKAAQNSSYQVRKEDLKKWEAKHGQIPKGAIVIMNSGWTYRYPNKTLTFNSANTKDPSTFRFPGWHEDTVEWLLNNRDIHVIGVDTPSTDYGRSTTFPVHVIMGLRNIPGVENVANLDAIPEAGAFITVGAVKLDNGSGGPVRMLATLPGTVSSAAPAHLLKSVIATGLCSYVIIKWLS